MGLVHPLKPTAAAPNAAPPAGWYQSTAELRKQNSITRISVALQQANAATYYRWRASHLRAAAADACVRRRSPRMSASAWSATSSVP